MVWDQADIGAGDDRRDLGVGHRAVVEDVGLGQQGRQMGRVFERADQHQRAVRPGAGDGPRGLNVQSRVEGADVKQSRAGQAPRARRGLLGARPTARGRRRSAAPRQGPGRDLVDDRVADREQAAMPPRDLRERRQVGGPPAAVAGVGGKVVDRQVGDRPRPVEIAEAGDEGLRGDIAGAETELVGSLAQATLPGRGAASARRRRSGRCGAGAAAGAAGGARSPGTAPGAGYGP